MTISKGGGVFEVRRRCFLLVMILDNTLKIHFLFMYIDLKKNVNKLLRNLEHSKLREAGKLPVLRPDLSFL